MSQLKIQQKNNVEEEIELIKTTKENISELKAELECKQDLIMQEQSETFEKFSDLHCKRRIALDELFLNEIKLEELEYQKQELMRLRNQTIQVNHLGGTGKIFINQ